jgi:hypothetical protein
MIGQEDQLCVITNAYQLIGTNHHLECTFFRIPFNTMKILDLGTISLPLSNDAVLEWAGFSVDTHNMCIIDSKGIASMLFHYNSSWLWLPVLEINRVKKSIDHKYWPIMVRTNKLAYILLNGENKPPVHPQPVVATRAFRVPIIEVKEPKDLKGEGPNEIAHKFVLDSMLVNDMDNDLNLAMIESSGNNTDMTEFLDKTLKEQQVALDRTILKIFQEACRHQRNAQALDLCNKMCTDIVLQAAIKVANHFGRTNIAEKLQCIIEQKENEKFALESAQMDNQFSSQYNEVHHIDDSDQYPEPSSTTYNENRYHNNENKYVDLNETPSGSVKPVSILSKRLNRDRERDIPTYPVDHSAEDSPSHKGTDSGNIHIPNNPFARSSITSPSKKKSALSISDLKASPSPNKRPIIAVRVKIIYS